MLTKSLYIQWRLYPSTKNDVKLKGNKMGFDEIVLLLQSNDFVPQIKVL